MLFVAQILSMSILVVLAATIIVAYFKKDVGVTGLYLGAAFLFNLTVLLLTIAETQDVVTTVEFTEQRD